ncbi:MAG: gamma-glutamyl-gamma-aminobutyrate hydrolase family protein [Armatimonadetes bacterium]|nr:gamma-glutamyl-gamma-aminobutyrate hydrolase family protein [Armatimonadota bacterium]
MSKPVIAISVSAMTSPKNNRPFGRYYLERDYVDRVIAAGGAPVLIPPGTEVESIAPFIDGWVIPGGNDIDAALWGEPNHPEVENEYSGRTETERHLFGQIHPSAPILGICYGCQLMNVLHGGSLIQHLPDILGGDYHRGDPIQDYRVEPGTRLAGIVGEHAQGKSWHHQAVDRIGDGLKPVAWHEDGTIEALESTEGRWLVGLQWHPERTELPESEKLFEAFMEAVREFKISRSGVPA